MAKNTLPGSKAPKPQQEPRKPGRPPKPPTYRCCACGKEYEKQEGRFWKSSSSLFAGNKGFVPICRVCLDKYFTETLLPALDNNEYRSLEMLCQLCDWYYSEDAVEMSMKARDSIIASGRQSQENTNLCSLYGGRRGLRQVTKYGTTYIDTIAQRRNKIKEEKVAEDIFQEKIEYSKGKDIDPSVVHIFGFGYKPEEYTFLHEQYLDWTKRYDCQTKAQEELFINLCIAQLNVRLAQEARDQKAAADAMSTFQKLLDTAKLTPKQEKTDQLADTNTFGTLIKKWEDERPIPKPAPEWEDVDGIRKYINTWFFGHLCKMFRIENDGTAEYEEELSKYTVETPTFQYEDDEEPTDEFSDVIGSAKPSDF